MKINIKHFLIALIFAVAVAKPVSGQLIRTAYFMDKSTVRTSLNPAFTPEYGYVSFPVIGSLNVSYTSNKLALGDLLYQHNGKLVTFMDASVDADSFLKKLRSNNQMNFDFHTDILSAGWYRGEAFWTVGLALRGSASIGIPKTLFEMAKRGTGPEGTVYNISDIRTKIDSYAELSVGYSRPIDDQWTVGGKLKLLPGLGHADMKFDNLTAEMNHDRWRITSKGDLYTSVYGLKLLSTLDDQGEEYVNDVDYDTFGPAGFGAAIDLGVSYKFMDNLTFSASVLDLGFISWSKKPLLMPKPMRSSTSTDSTFRSESRAKAEA